MAEYALTQTHTGTESEKLNIIFIPSGFTSIDKGTYASGNENTFLGEVYNHVNDIDGRLWKPNWFLSNREYFDIYYVDDSGDDPWDSDGLMKTDTEINTLIANLPTGVTCKFSSSRTCRNIHVVIHNTTGCSESQASGYVEICRDSSEYCVLAHEFGHDPIGRLDDEYTSSVYAPCTNSVYSTNVHDAANTDKWLKYWDGNSWQDLITTPPYEGARYCTEDLYRPEEYTIMGQYWNGVDYSACDFDALGMLSMDKGLEKRLGVIEYNPPSLISLTANGATLNNGNTISGTVAIQAAFTDATDVARVEFYIALDGEQPKSVDIEWSTTPTSPYTAEFNLDTTAYTSGHYYLDVNAYDSHLNHAQNHGSLVVRDFYIQNIQTAGRILPSTDLTYLGAFRLPVQAGVAWNGRERGMSFRPDGDPENGNNAQCTAAGDPWDCCSGAGSGSCDGDAFTGSLFVLGTTSDSDNVRYGSEVTIPIPVISPGKDLGDLSIAEIIQGPARISGDVSSGVNDPLGDIEYFPRQGDQDSDRIYWTHYMWYSPPRDLEPIGMGEVDFSDYSYSGMWRLSDGADSYLHSKAYGKYLFEVPTSWADEHAESRYLGIGYARTGGSDQGIGPSLYAFAPWDQGNPPPSGANLSNTELLRYGGRPGDSDKWMFYAAPNDFWCDGAWLEAGSRQAVIFAGTKASRRWVDERWSYYYPASDQCSYGTASYSSGPYMSAILFYDVDDIEAVAGGTKPAYEPQPYAVMQLQEYMFNDYTDGCTSHKLMGVGYDRQNNLLYVEEEVDDIIHVFRVSESGSVPDSLPPSKPTNLVVASVSNTSITIEWDPSFDDNSGVSYMVFIQGRPIVVVDETEWVHANPEYYVAPYTYKVQAMDSVMNTNEESITVSQGTNDPFIFFIQGKHAVNPQSGDEISSVPFATVNEPYSYTPRVLGGTPPYRWSVIRGALPVGIDFDADTGEIHGIPTSTGTRVLTINAEDSNGSLYSRIIRFRVVASTCDADNDGYESESPGCGGQDTDDFNCNDNPGGSYVPAPLAYKSDNTILSWDRFEEDDLHTYMLYHGPSVGEYAGSIFVGSATEHDVSGLEGPFFSVTAFDTLGMESPKSNAVRIGMLFHRADTSGGGCVDMGELLDFIDLWFTDSQDVTMSEVMQAITLWKSQTGCPEP